MRAHRQQFISLEHWTSDFWLCRGMKFDMGMLGPTWSPPDRIDDWPGVHNTDPGEKRYPTGSATNHEAFQRKLGQDTKTVLEDNNGAIEKYTLMNSLIAAHDDSYVDAPYGKG
ncbi:hypothetical protein [Hoeflea sp.]|uniref:hypothetical protein n=1 Tax=Hoeflea sp. TaxID=1940281 RepID=UPI003B022ADB